MKNLPKLTEHSRFSFLLFQRSLNKTAKIQPNIEISKRQYKIIVSWMVWHHLAPCFPDSLHIHHNINHHKLIIGKLLNEIK